MYTYGWVPLPSAWNYHNIVNWLCCCCCSVDQLYLTLCYRIDCSTAGLPVPYHLPKFAQVPVHCIGDAVLPSHPLMPSPSPLNLFQHQGLFQWVSCLYQVTKILKLQLQHQYSVLAILQCKIKGLKKESPPNSRFLDLMPRSLPEQSRHQPWPWKIIPVLSSGLLVASHYSFNHWLFSLISCSLARNMNSRIRLTEFENPSPECKLVQPLCKTVRRFLKKPKLELPYDPAIPVLGINPEKTPIQKDPWTPIFIAALFTMVKTWKPPKYPSDRWMDKEDVVHIHKETLFSHKKRTE